MLPTLKQYRNWSLPSKYGFWGLVLAVIPLGFAVRDWIDAVPSYAILAFNYGKSEMTIYGDAGDFPEYAVIIRGANTHEAGIKAEYHWIKRRYPGYKPESRRVASHEEPAPKHKKMVMRDEKTGVTLEVSAPPKLPPRLFDAFEIRSWYGRKRTIFFDISPFIGKLSEPRPNGSAKFEEIDVAAERFIKLVDEEVRRREMREETVPSSAKN